MAPGFKDDSTVKSRLLLSRILTTAKPDFRAIVFLADSITDGNCSTVDTNNRWPDHIAERLQAENYPDIAVVNEAHPGDRVLTNGMGTNALSRFDISVLSHPRVSTVVMMMGINDIGWPGVGAITPSDPEPTAEDVVAGYKQIIDRAHAHGIRFVAVTLTPFIDTFKGTPLIARAAAMKPGGQSCPAFPCNGPPAIGVAGIAIYTPSCAPSGTRHRHSIDPNRRRIGAAPKD